MRSPLLTAWIALGFIGSAGVIFRAVEASDGWFTGPVANWVQAVGSLAAIAGLAIATAHQSEEQRRRDREARIDRDRRERERTGSAIEALALTLEFAGERAAHLAGVLRAAEPASVPTILKLYRAEFLYAQARLETVEWSIMSESGVGETVHLAQAAIASMYTDVGEFSEDFGVAAEDPEVIETMVRTVESVSRIMAKGARGLRAIAAQQQS